VPGPLRAAAGLTLLALASGTGCGREFFREWADSDVTEAVFEKSRDPRWRLPTFSIEPPALSRFADPYDPDRPPAPPDDYPAHALSPTAQIPHMQMVVPVEGTGYLEMLEAGPRYEYPGAPPNAVDAPPGAGALATPPPDDAPPPNAGPGPFAPNGQPGPAPLPPAALPELAPENSGPGLPALSPNNPGDTPASPSPVPGSLPQTRLLHRDPGVQTVAYQAPGAPATPPGADAQPAPGELPVTGLDDLGPAGEALVNPNAAELGLQGGQDFNPNQPPPFFQPDATPEERARMNEARARFAPAAGGSVAATLSPAYIEVDEALATGLPAGSRPYMLGPAQALQLGLINNRVYQYQVENIYTSSLTVTLNRFAFEPQFFAGVSPTGNPGLGVPPGASGNTSFFYRTKEAPGGQQSSLSLNEAAGFGKAFVFGGRVLAAFANTTTFNFVGRNPSQPTVQSSLPLSIVQPFLRGGGRAVTLEPLTQAERSLLYQVRAFARFRQQFMVYLLSSNQAADTGGAPNDPNVGFLQVLQNYQIAENTARIVAAYDQALEIFREFAKGGASSGISQLQVDQVDLQLQQQRASLIQAQTTYRISMDQYKQQLGLPPDVPIVPDRTLLLPFSNVFRQISDWERDPDHDPEQLDAIIGGLPQLENVVLDGRPLFEMPPGGRPQQVFADPKRQEEFLLTAERIALENRLDLMNQRAILYDFWRQIAVQANSLLPVFNVTYAGNMQTPTGTNNPFGFTSQSVQSQLSLQAELPLVRLNERNNFRLALINYQRQRRVLMQQEDTVKLQVRTEARQLIQFLETYEINKTALLLALRNRDQTLQNIIAPPAEGGGGAGTSQATQTINFITSITQILGQQNSVVQGWVQYQTGRLAFYRDLGILPYDEWEAYYEFFPSDAARSTRGTPATDNPERPSGTAPDVIPTPELGNP
jgi:hypothetical protein